MSILQQLPSGQLVKPMNFFLILESTSFCKLLTALLLAKENTAYPEIFHFD